VSAVSGNTAPAFGDYCQYNALISSTSDLIAPTPKIEVNISTSTDYFLKTSFKYSSGAPKHYGKIKAKRII
jgi:hypothetical protein